MGEFTLDTSGVVRVELSNTGGARELGLYRWHNLSPFTQGYVEAALREWFAANEEAVGRHLPGGAVHWDWLAPETLAAMLRDCVAFQARYPNCEATAAGGARFCIARKHAEPGSIFPPLTAYLGDDGKVYLREGQS